MKRYLVFCGDDSPRGGWEDFGFETDSRDEAVGVARRWTFGNPLRWAHIVDTDGRPSVIWSSGL